MIARERVRGPRSRLGAELAALIYIALVAEVATATGAFYVMFPELGALSHDVLTRPNGRWARAPIALMATPALTAIIGIFVTRAMPYGFLSVMLTVGGALIVIFAIRSPIAPAISAGLLPLVLGVKSWWYPPGVLFGTVLLAALSVGWKSLGGSGAEAPSESARDDNLSADALEASPAGYGWIGALMIFVALATIVATVTGLRFILFPPLVVIGYEMLGHPDICPWARRPLSLPIACFLTAAGGLVCVRFFGVGAPAAALAMAWGIAVLRVFDLHIPPALAIALLPMVMTAPTIAYPLSVGIGTLMLTVWLIAWRRITIVDAG